MKRREFLKYATATVALAALPVSLAAVIEPTDIKWYVQRDPGYRYAWRVMGNAEINGVPYMSTYIIDEDEDVPGEVSTAKVDDCKRMIMNDFARRAKLSP